MNSRPSNSRENICPNCRGVLRRDCCARSIEHHWKALPPQVKEFVTEQGHLVKDGGEGLISVGRLIKFWSSPRNIDLTRRVDICGAAWYLALIYLRLGLLEQARALTINGAFVHQCIISGIEKIKVICTSDAPKEDVMSELKCCTDGFYATKSAEKMESFIESYLPPDYQQTLTTFANLSTKSDVMGYVDQISDDFNSAKKHQKNPRDIAGAHMKLIIVDEDITNGKRHVFDILSTTTFKTMFTDYADERGISLRLIRFSLANEPLFLSQVGKKTPEELGLKDQDIILANDKIIPRSPQERTCKSPNQNGTSTYSSSKTKQRPRTSSSKGKKNKSKGKNKSTKHEPPIKIEKTEEELKIEHSKALSKIHEELQPRLKRIRQRLNNLLLERSQRKPKLKRQNSERASLSQQSWADIPCAQCLGGKAGKSQFVVQVGEIENLYKTKKFSSYTTCQTTLDLHGATKKEALQKLDEGLQKWLETAMQDTYPFVIQVKIICGCGNQILSQVVQEWIKSKRNVSNAPKKT